MIIKESFIDDLAKTINKHGLDSKAGTSDCVLAFYLAECYLAYLKTRVFREE